MPPDRPSTTDAEAVLADVVAQPQHQRLPDLGLVGEPLGDAAVGGRARGVAQRGQLGRHDRPGDAASRPGRPAAAASGRGRQVEVDDEQLLGELRGPGEQRAVGGHDHRVAVEDQLVLAADHVHVRDGRAAPRRPGAAPAAAVRRPCSARTASR